MKKLMVFTLALVVAVPMLASVSEARRSMMDEVNSVCGPPSPNYSCGLCHVNAGGGGSLTSQGDGYLASGTNACFFCPNDADCGGGSGGCKPTREKCGDGKDNDCDGAIDCADSNCAKNRLCK